MASAAIAIGARLGISALVRRFAPGRLREAETHLGPGTGPTKMAMVLASLRPVLEQLAAAGVAEAVPEDSALRKILEEVLIAEKAKPDWAEKGILRAGGKTFVVQVLAEL